MSGGPVSPTGSIAGGTPPCAIAIHAEGPHGSTAPHSTENHGTRITAAVTAFLTLVLGQYGRLLAPLTGRPPLA